MEADSVELLRLRLVGRPTPALRIRNPLARVRTQDPRLFRLDLDRCRLRFRPGRLLCYRIRIGEQGTDLREPCNFCIYLRENCLDCHCSSLNQVLTPAQLTRDFIELLSQSGKSIPLFPTVLLR